MIKRYNNLSFLFFIPGMIAQIVGVFLVPIDKPPHSPVTTKVWIGIALMICGTIMAVTGFAYYAKAKGRNPVYGVLGFLGLPGLLLLAVLKDRSGDPWNT